MRFHVIVTLSLAIVLMGVNAGRSQMTADEAAKKYEAGFQASPDDAQTNAEVNSSVEVSAFGKAERDSCAVGQTVEYTLSITAKAARGKGVAFRSYETPQAQGLDIINQTQKTKKLFQGDREITTLIKRIEYRCASEGTFDLGPVTIPYSIQGEDDSESTVTAVAVSITVKAALADRMRSSPSGKWIAFVAGLAVFGIILMVIKRRFSRKRLAEQAATKAREAAKIKVNPWDELEKDAEKGVDGDFYAQLEELFWMEAFYPDTVPEGAAATRISMLAQRQVPAELLKRVRKVVNACQVGRYNGSVSRGDAMSALTQARQIVEKLSVYRPEKIEEDDNGITR